MNKLLIAAVLVSGWMVMMVPPAWAGAKIEVSEDVSFELGLTLQPQFMVTERDLNGDGNAENTEDFRVRRARLRFWAHVTDQITGFVQTEMARDGQLQNDMRIIDAVLTYKPNMWSQVLFGQHMAPASRQNLTAAGALMALDYPGITYKTLTWGTRSVTRFANSTFEEGDAGLRGETDVRDTGATLFGSGSFSDTLHLKYYVGAYDGVQAPTSDDLRFTTRAQLNLFDPEAKYFNLSTYLGKKKTVALGASYDVQPNVGEGPVKGQFDYGFYTVDFLVEWPVGPGAVTFETAYQDLDLDDAMPFTLEDGTESTADPGQSQGNGYYAQTGYYWNQWQPWVEFESWDSDADDDKGSYDMYRVGITYFIKGHTANIKAGYEHVSAKTPMRETNEDSLNTFVLGAYLNY